MGLDVTINYVKTTSIVAPTKGYTAPLLTPNRCRFTINWSLYAWITLPAVGSGAIYLMLVSEAVSRYFWWRKCIRLSLYRVRMCEKSLINILPKAVCFYLQFEYWYWVSSRFDHWPFTENVTPGRRNYNPWSMNPSIFNWLAKQWYDLKLPKCLNTDILAQLLTCTVEENFTVSNPSCQIKVTDNFWQNDFFIANDSNVKLETFYKCKSTSVIY